MRLKTLFAPLLGTTMIVGLAGVSLAGDVATAEAANGVPAMTNVSQPSLAEATRAETQANEALRAAVAERDSAQVALQTALEKLNDVKVQLDQLPANDSDRAELKHTAAKLRREINARLFAALDDAKDKVTTARQTAEKATADKRAVEAELLSTSAPSDPAVEVAAGLSARR
jgi:chromosome segregation ATPase